MAQIRALNLLLQGVVTRQNKALMAARKRDPEIKELKEKIGRQEARLEQWARDNRDEFIDGKTLGLRHGEIGFKCSPPSIQLLQGWTDALVLARLRRLKKWSAYIRTKEEIDRQRILSDARPEVGKLTAKALETVGLGIARVERFFAHPAIEEAK